MSNTVIKIENLSKQYRLGVWGSSTLRDEFARGWAKLCGKQDPTLTIGSSNTLDTVDQDYVWALKDINLEVKQGEVLGIIGKNGAGKSTLLKILSRVTSPTTGSIKAKGRIASLLEVGTGMHEEMTGRENIFLNGAILGMTKWEIRNKFDEIVDFAGIVRYVDTPIKRYSSGMRVRLGFAIAAFLEPEILIVDEVLAVGDAEFQKKAIGKMQDVSKGEGRTVLFVSHNMTSIQNLCTSAVLLYEGTIYSKDKVEQIIDQYNKKNDSSSVPIEKRTDRLGNQKLQIINACIYNTNNVKTNKIGFRKKFHIEIEVSGSEKNLILGILFGNRTINQICRAYSYESYPETISFTNKTKIKCYFDSLPLVPGNYNIHLYLGIQNEVIDYIETALEFSIQEEDIFSTGKKMNSTVPCYVEHKWEFINN